MTKGVEAEAADNRSTRPPLARRLALRPSPAVKVVIVLVLLVWPLVLNSAYGMSVMTTAGLYALLTLSVSVIMGHAGQLSFGHSAFYGIGAYTAALLATKAGVPTLAALVASPIACAIVAVIVGRAVLHLRYFYLALATIGLGQIFLVIVTEMRDVTGGLNGLRSIPDLNLFGLAIDSYMREYYLVWLIALPLLIFTERALRYRTGRSLRAVAASEIAASTLGVRTANWKLLAFTVSAAYCGVAGALFGFIQSALSPWSFSFSAAVLPIIMMLLGGVGSLWGGLVGAVVMTWVVNGFTGTQQYSGLIYAVILVLLLLFLPTGITDIRWASRLAGVTRRMRGTRVQTAADVPEHVTATAPATRAKPEPALAPETPARAERPLGDPLLSITEGSVDFGGLHALRRVSLTATEGDITAVIGPNGAGKTTLFNVFSRLQKPTSGDIQFAGRDIKKLSAADVARLGMARTFQNLRIFQNMTVLENVLIGCHRHERARMLACGLGLRSQRREERRSRADAQLALEMVGLPDSADKPASSLPYGQQRLVEIARALATKPRLLLLDEPAAGMNPAERVYLVERISRLREAGLTVLLVEHDIDLVMGVSDVVHVLDHGNLIASGAPAVVRQNPEVIQAYLGVRRGERDLCLTRELLQEEKRPLLRVEGVETSYGSIKALHGVSLEVPEGEIVTVLGANGAGKSTLLHTISGVLKPGAGHIYLEETEITRLAPAKIVGRGICHVPEGRRLFPTLTVEDNLLLASPGQRRRSSPDLAYVYDLFPQLASRRRQVCGTLSGGEQQMVAIGRALMGKPRLLLLDEPSMGLAPLLVEHIFEALAKLNSQGITMLMVEQNAEMALSIAHRAIVLQTGSVVLSGVATELRGQDAVRECYLGQS
jgi:ABC-type branched-subunit amino acid transport system ATPase component/ABC-type branched-subunit amino acid transport system permease subunit